ncbi:MAG TPA: cytochrome c [Myxococcota bacterium]|nr:cytochrome c [Myxococcota bacterium]HRY94907.1 cytochrome c [Myxococcota bacterium]HSA21815.1 cytochrome c [Myxococcota bacterium]
MSARVWQVWGGLLLGLLGAGCMAGAQLAEEQLQHPGQLLFNGHASPEVDCYRCHGGDGLGSGRGPGLAARVAALPDEAILKVIDRGAAFMPAYRGRVSPEEQAQLLAWLRSAFGGGQASAAAEVEAEEIE